MAYACVKCLLFSGFLCAADDAHHILYTLPNGLTVPLCRVCHWDITGMNTDKARELGRKLTDRERCDVFMKWINNDTLFPLSSHDSYRRSQERMPSGGMLATMNGYDPEPLYDDECLDIEQLVETGIDSRYDGEPIHRPKTTQ